jgi:aerobic carbon-monoxide dehydrogenase medium subunit
MKPARFAYARPRDLAAALEILASERGTIKIIAGGQSIGPMLNLRLVEPDLVVDVAGLPELRQAALEGDRLVLGACVTHADIEDGRVPDVTGGAMARVASAIAYRAVRNRGTVGGSLVHADPAADWVTALLALGAEVELAARTERRRLPLADFVTGALEVALRPGEMLVAVRVPAVSANSRWGYVKHCRKVGEFAHAIGSVALDPASGQGRAVIGAVEAAPVIIADARRLFGGRVGSDFVSRFDPKAADQALIDAGMTDGVDRHVHVTVLRRAIMQAGGLGAVSASAA